jgi:hypothetical protein
MPSMNARQFTGLPSPMAKRHERALFVDLFAGSAILDHTPFAYNPAPLAGASEARQIGANFC